MFHVVLAVLTVPKLQVQTIMHILPSNLLINWCRGFALHFRKVCI